MDVALFHLLLFVRTFMSVVVCVEPERIRFDFIVGSGYGGTQATLSHTLLSLSSSLSLLSLLSAATVATFVCANVRLCVL